MESTMTAKAHPGTCELCGYSATRAKMARHLATCAPEHDAAGPVDDLIRLQVEASGAPEYWLQIEVRATATLAQLDGLLRSTWLECCGHLSAFRLGRSELSKRTIVGELPSKGRAFDYEYDFGSTTSLTGCVVGRRYGSRGRRAVRLLARNAPLPWTCSECEAPAAVVCPQCADEYPSVFCAAHGESHPCSDDIGFLPLVNSPRTGVCGYTG